jgi:ABC-type nickel/cobalt efflux system permease component RcnA
MRRARALIVLATAVTLSSAAAHAAMSPFGIATPDATGGFFGGPLGPVFAWVAVHQAAFYRSLTAALSSLKTSPAGLWLFFGLSFAYGVFHAVGPGHGKAVISSYLMASGESVRRGIALSFLAALVQAASAILIVLIGTIMLRVTATTMTAATDKIEIASYALITLFGAWLLWAKLRGGDHHHHHHHFVPGTTGRGHDAHDDGHDHDHTRDHDRDRHEPRQDEGHAGHAHHHDHHHGDGCDHDHAHGHDHGIAPAPADHAGRAATSLAVSHPAGAVTRGFTRAWSAVLSVGIRPCSGAIIILVFAWSQGLFAAGVGATLVMSLGTGLTVATLAALAVSARGVALRLAEGGTGATIALRFARGIEIAGAAAVLILGIVLLGGALSGAGAFAATSQ